MNWSRRVQVVRDWMIFPRRIFFWLRTWPTTSDSILSNSRGKVRSITGRRLDYELPAPFYISYVNNDSPALPTDVINKRTPLTLRDRARKTNMLIITCDAPAHPPAAISAQTGIVPSAKVSRSRMKSFMVSLIAFSGATPTSWGIKPRERRDSVTCLSWARDSSHLDTSRRLLRNEWLFSNNRTSFDRDVHRQCSYYAGFASESSLKESETQPRIVTHAQQIVYLNQSDTPP